MNIHCSKCNLDKDEKEFAPCAKERPYWCRICLRYYAREWRAKHGDQSRAKNRKRREDYKAQFEKRGVTITEKRCPACEKTKPALEFPLDRSRKDGLYPECRKCNAYRTRWTNCLKYDRTNGFHTCTKEEVYEIIKRPCVFCSHAPSMGIDRIDNTKGHESSNIQPCCDFCNIARSDHFTVDEMRRYIGPAIKAARESRKIVI